MKFKAWDKKKKKFINRKLVNINGHGEIFLVSYVNKKGEYIIPIRESFSNDIEIIQIK